MAKYITYTWDIFVLGYGFYGQKSATFYRLNPQQVEKCRDAEGKLTRESVDKWVNCKLNIGDFDRIIDWSASLGDEAEIPFSSEENQNEYYDITHGDME